MRQGYPWSVCWTSALFVRHCHLFYLRVLIGPSPRLAALLLCTAAPPHTASTRVSASLQRPIAGIHWGWLFAWSWYRLRRGGESSLAFATQVGCKRGGLHQSDLPLPCLDSLTPFFFFTGWFVPHSLVGEAFIYCFCSPTRKEECSTFARTSACSRLRHRITPPFPAQLPRYIGLVTRSHHDGHGAHCSHRQTPAHRRCTSSSWRWRERGGSQRSDA